MLRTLSAVVLSLGLVTPGLAFEVDGYKSGMSTEDLLAQAGSQGASVTVGKPHNRRWVVTYVISPSLQLQVCHGRLAILTKFVRPIEFYRAVDALRLAGVTPVVRSPVSQTPIPGTEDGPFILEISWTEAPSSVRTLTIGTGDGVPGGANIYTEKYQDPRTICDY